MGIANFETDTIYQRWLDKLDEESQIQRVNKGDKNMTECLWCGRTKPDEEFALLNNGERSVYCLECEKLLALL